MIMLITGKAQAGKTTVANMLAEFGCNKLAFATPIRFMLNSLLQYIGMKDVGAEGNKNISYDIIGGKTYRELLQLTGTEFGRNMIDKDIWANIQFNEARRLLDEFPFIPIVFDDVRFENEIKIFLDNGYNPFVINIEREKCLKMEHESEQQDLSKYSTYTIVNNGTIQELAEYVDIMITEYIQKR